MNIFKQLIIIGLLISQVSIAGTETHGGHTVSENGKKWLRDLIDKTSCRWKTGKKFSKKIKGFTQVQEKIKKGHPYLGELIDKQIKNVRVCLAFGNLRPVPEEDQEIFLPYSIQGGRQVATRVVFPDDTKDIIFIDSKEYEQLSEDQKPYLFFHELAHGFIPKAASIRSIRLRSFIASLYDMKDEESYDWEDLQLLVDASLISTKAHHSQLGTAAKKGQLKKVRDLISKGADIYSSNAFYLAIASGHVQTTKYLLTKIDFNKLGDYTGVMSNHFYQYCGSKDLSTAGGLNGGLGNYADTGFGEPQTFETLPVIYRIVINLSCKRPKNAKTILKLILKSHQDIDWGLVRYLQEEGTLAIHFTYFGAPDFALTFLNQTKVQMTGDERANLKTNISIWLSHSSPFTMLNSTKEAVRRYRHSFYYLYKRAGGKHH